MHDIDNGIYKMKDGHTYALKVFADERKTWELLANFSAIIKADFIHNKPDNQTRMALISINTANGVVIDNTMAFPKFESLSWVSELLGSDAWIEPGYGKNAKLVTAIKALSTPTIECVYGWVGFSVIDDKLMYLHAGGALTRNGCNVPLQVSLQGKLALLDLPSPRDRSIPDLYETIVNVFYSLARLSPRKPILQRFILATVFRAIISEFFPAEFSVFLVGESGTYKSQIAALIQSFFGCKYDSRNLPENFSSTKNALQVSIAEYKDVVVVVDDYVGETELEKRELKEKAELLFRGAANNAGKSRLNANLDVQKGATSKGLICATGESIPEAAKSINYRLVFFHVNRDDIDLVALQKCQDMAREGAFSLVAADFISWMIELVEIQTRSGAVDLITRKHDWFRKFLSDGLEKIHHPRIVENVASLAVGYDLFMDYCSQKGAFEHNKLRDWKRDSEIMFRELAANQYDIISGVSRGYQLISAFKKLLQNGKCYLLDYVTGKELTCKNTESLGWHNQTTHGTHIGWVDIEHKRVYVLHKNMLLLLRSELEWLSTERVMMSALNQERLLVLRDDGRDRNVIRRKMPDGQSYAVIALSLELFY